MEREEQWKYERLEREPELERDEERKYERLRGARLVNNHAIFINPVFQAYKSKRGDINPKGVFYDPTAFNAPPIRYIAYHPILGDGHCLFRSLAWISQDFGVDPVPPLEEYHRILRHKIVSTMSSMAMEYIDGANQLTHPGQSVRGTPRGQALPCYPLELFYRDQHISSDENQSNPQQIIDDWVQHMSNDEWGDANIIQAFCNIYVYGILLIDISHYSLQLFEPNQNCISPKLESIFRDSVNDGYFNNLDRYRILFYSGNNHYDSVLPYSTHPTHNLLNYMRANNAAAATSNNGTGSGGTISYNDLIEITIKDLLIKTHVNVETKEEKIAKENEKQRKQKESEERKFKLLPKSKQEELMHYNEEYMEKHAKIYLPKYKFYYNKIIDLLENSKISNYWKKGIFAKAEELEYLMKYCIYDLHGHIRYWNQSKSCEEMESFWLSKPLSKSWPLQFRGLNWSKDPKWASHTIPFILKLRDLYWDVHYLVKVLEPRKYTILDNFSDRELAADFNELGVKNKTYITFNKNKQYRRYIPNLSLISYIITKIERDEKLDTFWF